MGLLEVVDLFLFKLSFFFYLLPFSVFLIYGVTDMKLIRQFFKEITRGQVLYIIFDIEIILELKRSIVSVSQFLFLKPHAL